MDGADYRRSLQDGRTVFFNGERVDDVTEDPRFAGAVDVIAAAYDRDAENPSELEALYQFPTSIDELRARTELLASWEVTRATTLESLLALQTAAGRMDAVDARYRERVHKYAQHCHQNSLTCVQTITDAKGHRKLAPSEQFDPDLYVHVVDRSAEGVTIRGAKMHISAAALAHELVVIPTKRMRQGEEEWAIACAVPVNAPGVSIINTNPSPPATDADYHPFSVHHTIPEGMVIFDDVFVPHERVFLDGQVQYSATFAHSLGLWQRLGAVARAADEADMLVGFAQLLADANGLTRVAHIRDKISELIIYASLVRAGLEAAITNSRTTEDGHVIPDEVFTNAAKYYGASELDRAMRHVHDIGGGAILTAPLPGDLLGSETKAFVEKYMATQESVTGAYRTRLMHAVRDITADTYGGWWRVSSLMSGGGLYAQKMVATKNYDMERARRLALDAAGLEAPDA